MRKGLLSFLLPFAAAMVGSAAGIMGLGLALAGPWGEPLSATAPALSPATTGGARRPGEQKVVVLGDSISRGTGDALGGYAARVTKRWNEQGKKVELVNLAVDGSETGDVLRALGEARVESEVKSASWVFVSAAGNDLSHALRGQRGNAAEAGSAGITQDLPAALLSASKNLSAILAKLKAIAPDAGVRLIGLYNPLEVQLGSETDARAILLDWNIALERASLEATGSLVVPVADLFDQRADRLAKDRYHPGPSGHAAIAERLLSTLPD